MQIYKFVLKTTLILAAIALPITWLVTTNSGLNTALMIASCFAPVKISYATASGQLIGKTITLTNIEITDSQQKLRIAQININWHAKKFSLHNIQGLENFLPGQQLLAMGKQTILEQVHGTVKIGLASQQIDLAINGQWQQEPLTANVHILHNENNWQLKYADLKIASNSLIIQPITNNGFSWDLKILHPQSIFKDGRGSLSSSGQITDLAAIPKLSAKLNADHFSLQDYAVKKLAINATSDQILLTADKITAFNENINNLKILIAGKVSKQKNTWHIANLTLGYKEETLSGSAKFNTETGASQVTIEGKPFTFPTNISLTTKNYNELQAKIALHADPLNNITAAIKIKGQQLDGQVNLKATNLDLIMEWLPDITRLKGKLNARIKLSGRINAPTLISDAHLTDITATIPALGVKIKPMHLHVTNDRHGKLILKGHGKMRRGPGEFSLDGFIEPFKANMPNALNIVGTSVEFVNNQTAHLIASNKLKLSYDFVADRLDIIGNIEIEKGNIYFNSKQTNTVKSKDVVFIDHKPQTKQTYFNINPDINLRIQDGVHFNGFGLDADITGKLDINQRQDTVYATGRISIKSGTFELPGQKLQIQKGRLLFPPGTLLSNPALDIKMRSTPHTTTNNSVATSDLDLFIHGTAQAPIISDTGMAGNQDKALSQAILAGSSVLSKNILQDKLKVTELGIVSQITEGSAFFENPAKNKSSLRNKDFVIGRPLGNKLYLQYLHSMGKANKRVRLKYALNKNWSLGLESGDHGGGADLSFAIERD